MNWAVRIAHGDHHAVEYGELIGPLTDQQAAVVNDAHDASELIWKDPTTFEEWQRERAAWNEDE
jgi:hypothetical protein